VQVHFAHVDCPSAQGLPNPLETSQLDAGGLGQSVQDPATFRRTLAAHFRAAIPWDNQVFAGHETPRIPSVAECLGHRFVDLR
jgi:hypothetical protein